MKYLKKRGNVFYYRRAVPTNLRKAIGRDEFVVSLKTTREIEAIKRFPSIHAQCEALFQSYRLDPKKAEKDYLTTLKAIAEAIGIPYASAASKITLSDSEKLRDFEKAVEKWVRLGKPTNKMFSAIWRGR